MEAPALHEAMPKVVAQALGPRRCNDRFNHQIVAAQACARQPGAVDGPNRVAGPSHAPPLPRGAVAVRISASKTIVV
jgi:hypothetical protein